MADKKFHIPGGVVTEEKFAADFEAAPEFDKVKVGKLGVYYRDGLKTRLVPFDIMERAFIRVQEVRGRMCCGSAIFAYFRLIFLVNGKEIICDHISEKEEAMDAALAKIAENAPAVAIGIA